MFANSSFYQNVVELPFTLLFAYGSVEEKFIKRLEDRYGDTSYFFESASGYGLALMLQRLQSRLIQETVLNPWDLLDEVDLSGVPLGGISFVNTPEYGRHFEMGSRIYDIRN